MFLMLVGMLTWAIDCLLFNVKWTEIQLYSWLITGCVTRVTRRVPHVEQELLSLSSVHEFTLGFQWGSCCSFFSVQCFEDHCWYFFFWTLCCLSSFFWTLYSPSFEHCIVCPPSFEHCVVCPPSFEHCIVCPPSFEHCTVCPPSSIYGFWFNTPLLS